AARWIVSTSTGGESRAARPALICCFFLLIPRPPTATLFPYTTLFRSHRRPCRLTEPPAPELQNFVPGTGTTRCRMVSDCSPSGRDRKSTRLNSSHVSTSYAVFCLKKKNNQRRPLRLHEIHSWFPALEL